MVRFYNGGTKLSERQVSSSPGPFVVQTASGRKQDVLDDASDGDRLFELEDVRHGKSGFDSGAGSFVRLEPNPEERHHMRDAIHDRDSVPSCKQKTAHETVVVDDGGAGISTS